MFFRVLMDQMNDHVVCLAINFLFAGMMKMKLQELVSFPSNRHGAVPIAVHLYRVAIIDNLQYRLRVMELYRRQVRGN